LFYNKYVLFIYTSLYVYKYVYSWPYCPMYKEINCYIYPSRERYIFNHQLSQLKPRFVAEAINLHVQ